jgi:dinuclear metal center YbgI/SA1388 family protein
MILLKDLNNYLDSFFGQDLINKARKKDKYLANGLQLLGKEKIKKLVLGTSATNQFLKEAVKIKADSVIVHHSLPLFHAYKLISPYLYKRLVTLIRNDVSLFGYHYILDSHPELGNNAQIIKMLGAKKLEPFYDEWGWTAEFAKPVSRKKLAEKLSDLINHDIFIINGDKDMIKKLGVVSGGGVPREKEIQEAIDKDIDLYITGEVEEATVGIFQELGINYFASGHYATEVFGVQALGKKIKAEFKDKLEVEFLDIPNPI